MGAILGACLALQKSSRMDRSAAATSQLPFSIASNYSRPVKKRHTLCRLLIALTFAVLAGSETTGASAASANSIYDAEAGRVTINRLPNLGGGITAFVTIDGVSAGRIRYGQSYHSSLVPGDHFISIMVYPNHMILSPAEKRFKVQGGQSYMFTLKWQGDRLVLM